MANEQQRDAPEGQIVIYRDGATRLQVRVEGRTVWLSQRLMAELFQVSVKTVNEHLVNIYGEDELDREATIRSFRIVQREGSRDVTRSIDHYSLAAILAVGYRVRSARATVFRQWVTAGQDRRIACNLGGSGLALKVRKHRPLRHPCSGRLESGPTQRLGLTTRRRATILYLSTPRRISPLGLGRGSAFLGAPRSVQAGSGRVAHAR